MNDKKTITITIEEYNLLLEKQKQVDELKAYAEDIYKKAIDREEDAYSLGFDKGKEQAVKETVKEIKDKIQELLNTPFNGKTEKQEYQRKGMEEGLKMALDIVRECKGVEVE